MIEFTQNIIDAIGIMGGIGFMLLMIESGIAIILHIYMKGKKK